MLSELRTNHKPVSSSGERSGFGPRDRPGDPSGNLRLPQRWEFDDEWVPGRRYRPPPIPAPRMTAVGGRGLKGIAKRRLFIRAQRTTEGSLMEHQFCLIVTRSGAGRSDRFLTRLCPVPRIAAETRAEAMGQGLPKDPIRTIPRKHAPSFTAPRCLGIDVRRATRPRMAGTVALLRSNYSCSAPATKVSSKAARIAGLGATGMRS